VGSTGANTVLAVGVIVPRQRGREEGKDKVEHSEKVDQGPPYSSSRGGQEIDWGGSLYLTEEKTVMVGGGGEKSQGMVGRKHGQWEG